MQVTDQPRHQPSPAPPRDASTHRWDDEPTIPRTPAPRPRRLIGGGDSDPSADELLRRARQTRANATICPNCGGLIVDGQHACRPKYAPVGA